MEAAASRRPNPASCATTVAALVAVQLSAPAVRAADAASLPLKATRFVTAGTVK